MRITKHTPFAGLILVVKNNFPVGCVEWIDTLTKEYAQLTHWGNYAFSHTATLRHEKYDRVLICPEENHLEEDEVKNLEGVEIVTLDELTKLRKEWGVSIG